MLGKDSAKPSQPTTFTINANEIKMRKRQPPHILRNYATILLIFEMFIPYSSPHFVEIKDRFGDNSIKSEKDFKQKKDEQWLNLQTWHRWNSSNDLSSIISGSIFP